MRMATSGRHEARAIPMTGTLCADCGAESDRLKPVHERQRNRRIGRSIQTDTITKGLCPPCYQLHPQSKRDAIKHMEGAKTKLANRARNKRARIARRYERQN